jgi:hypothetical protein
MGMDRERERVKSAALSLFFSRPWFKKYLFLYLLLFCRIFFGTFKEMYIVVPPPPLFSLSFLSIWR